MIDDFVPIVHRLDGRPIKVYAVADVHLGAKEADVRGFKDFLGRVQADDDAYLVIVGDVLNNCTRSSVSNIYEELIPPSSQIDLAAELLAPVAGKILGCVGGNHEFRSLKEVDLDPLFGVMMMLRSENPRLPELYRQNFAFVRIALERGNTHDSYVLYLTHGKSAARQKKFAESGVEGVDAIVQGHTHAGNIAKHARIAINNRNKIFVRSVISLTATSWLNYGGYSARAQMLPTSTASGYPQYLLLDFTGSNNNPGSIHVVW